MSDKIYIAIDLKSFYASVECVDRGLDPINVNLVVADSSRTDKTICLAVSPALKTYGIPGRARLFEVKQKVKEINSSRLNASRKCSFSAKSIYSDKLSSDLSLELDFLTAPPRMSRYIEISNDIYNIYLQYIAPEDIHVYSIDEVFIDATSYLKHYNGSAYTLAMTLIHHVLDKTGITATAGIGTNLYLAKVAMDIDAKHMPPDKDGVRMSYLNETTYRQKLWTHTPLTDFWMIGRGISKKLNSIGLFTMGDIAKCSIGKPVEYYNEDLLYRLFGINAELIIDHAWGWEPCTISDIKSYHPKSSSICMGQVLHCPYPNDKAHLIAMEMSEQLASDLALKKLATSKLNLYIGYDVDNLKDPAIASSYNGPIHIDHYGRKVPEKSGGTINLDFPTSSPKLISEAVSKLFMNISSPLLLIRRINISAENVIDEKEAESKQNFRQLNLFDDFLSADKASAENKTSQKERSVLEAVLKIRYKYGKNAVLKGINLLDGATGRSRNAQIGGHKA